MVSIVHDAGLAKNMFLTFVSEMCCNQLVPAPAECVLRSQCLQAAIQTGTGRPILPGIAPSVGCMSQ